MAPRRTSSSPQPTGRLPQPPLIEFDKSIPPVRRVLIAMARRLFQICTTATAEVLADEDLTPAQYAVLGYVNGEPGIDQAGLAARMGVDRNNASLLADELQRKRLLERRVNDADRRARLLRLTPRGTALYA